MKTMKQSILIIVALLSLAACKTSDKKAEGSKLTQEEKEKAIADTSNYTTLEWLDPKTKDLGQLTKDQTIEISFRYKNAGNKNLVFENVWAQCGCTIPEKPEKPIAPGEEGVLKAKFNGTGSGVISKAIYIKANIRPDTNDTLHFTGSFKEN
jgi:hypothetical protein